MRKSLFDDDSIKKEDLLKDWDTDLELFQKDEYDVEVS